MYDRMKRFLLPASALVLVVTACGAGAKPAPRVTQVSARLRPSVHALAIRRKHAAALEAKRLLREFQPPPGARRTREPEHYGRILRRSGSRPLGETVEAHRLWSVTKPFKSVVAFLRTHRPPGFEPSGASWGSREPHYLVMSLTGPHAGGRSPTRFLTVTSLALARRTLVRAGVQVAWIYPRSPNEKVPSATRKIVVRAPKVSVTVTDPAVVARIARWFDALPVSPPAIAVACPLVLAEHITLSFRGAHGRRLARASVPATSASICAPIAFQIGGRAKSPLVDRGTGENFALRLQRLLGVRLVRTHR